LDALVSDINATGYGLTFGIHTRIDETIARVTARVAAGNIYVNRNIIGAVVGVQPFGGHGLSGTGPKAGGPLYIRRLLAMRPAMTWPAANRLPEMARTWGEWLAQEGGPERAAAFMAMAATTPFGMEQHLAGPVGERNLYAVEPRGAVLCVSENQQERLTQIGAALVTGNRAVVSPGGLDGLPPLPAVLGDWVTEPADANGAGVAAILFSGDASGLRELNQAAAGWAGPIVPVHVADSKGHYPLEWLVQERSVSVNTTAAGGNANLMMIG